MPTETAPAAAASTNPLRALISAELDAIKARVKAAVTKEQKRVAESQFGQRLLHLADRLTEIDADLTAPEGTPGRDGE